jgi:type III restriction enzyme
MALSTREIPTKTENAPIVGESSIHTLDDLKRRMEKEVAFLLAKLVLEKYFGQDNDDIKKEPTDHHKFDSEVKSWLFPQVLQITKQWLSNCVIYKDNTFSQMLLLITLAHDAADKIYQSIVGSESGEKILKPILRPYDTLGSTRYVDFDTTKDTYKTDPEKCHISHVVIDSGWEAKMAQSIEEMHEVVCYAKNQNLGFSIPYTMEGKEHKYIPDFIVCINNRKAELINMIIEVSGEAKKDKAIKTSTTRNFWIPAINNHGGFGKWAFIEISDPWDAKNIIRAEIQRIFPL